MEKPFYYDLLIDLTTSTPNKATRPTFYLSKPIPSSQAGSSRGPTHRLSTVRFAWSDVKLVMVLSVPAIVLLKLLRQWNEIDRILLLDSDRGSHTSCCCTTPSTDSNGKSKSVTAWTDAWQVYEDVCIICAGLWMGSWRGNSPASYSTANGPENWGSVRLEGDDDLTLDGTYVRNVGMGIEGRPTVGGSTLSVSSPAPRNTRRISAMSWSSGKTSTAGTLPSSSNSRTQQASSTQTGPVPITTSSNGEVCTLNPYTNTEDVARRRNGQLMTALAVLQTFHAHISFQISVLENLLAQQDSASSDADSGEAVVYMTPKDILAFELGPFSSFDARYLEWLGQEYGVRVVVKRGWKDLLNAIFGYG